MIYIHIFANYKTIIGFNYIEINLPSNNTTLDMILKNNCFIELPNNALFAINETFVSRHTILKDGDKVAIMPPVSGG